MEGTRQPDRKKEHIMDFKWTHRNIRKGSKNKKALLPSNLHRQGHGEQERESMSEHRQPCSSLLSPSRPSSICFSSITLAYRSMLLNTN